MKVALFGTSADPPTIAHQDIIRWLALQQFDRVAIWAADNPFKAHGATLEQRSQMLELLIKEIEPPLSQHVRVYRKLSSKRTIESLIIAQQIWVGAEFILTVGADLIPQLPRWYQASELLTQVKLLIVPRIGSNIEKNDLQKLVELGARIEIAPLATPIISSSTIRNNHTTQGVSTQVATYIQQHHLYSLIDDSRDRAKLK